MTLHEINKLYNRIIGDLNTKELKNAFDSIQALIAGTKSFNFQDKLNELQETYQYMLRYRIEGMQDPMQDQIYKTLQINTYELADRLRQNALAIESPLAFYNKRRTLSVQPHLSYAEMHDQLRDSYLNGQRRMFDNLTDMLFNKVWVSSFLSQEETEDLISILKDNELPNTVGSQLVSALLLAQQNAFDKEKMLLLLDAANLADDEIRIRAFIVLLDRKSVV